MVQGCLGAPGAIGVKRTSTSQQSPINRSKMTHKRHRQAAATRSVGAGEQRRRGANGQAYLNSETVLRIARKASALAVDMGLPFIPRVTRDAIYDLVARNRYRWFGRRDACILPNSDRS